MHMSVPLNQSCEFIDIVSINPLISKCQIKVCYVSDVPNRNRTVITKEFAKKLAQTIPGSPIVGYYNEETEDFEEHNEELEITEDQQIIFKPVTFPYGFVDVGAKVWFQKFVDDGKDVREYLMTEGYIWTGQFPEAKRIITKGNNQSMELDQKTIQGVWSEVEKGTPQFFIINEAIMSKLCILGEEIEPCFEGAQIKSQFSLDENFMTQFNLMVSELKKILNEGGEKQNMFTMTIGDSTWNSLYSILEEKYPSKKEKSFGSEYKIIGFSSNDELNNITLKSNDSGKCYSLNFSLNEENKVQVEDTLLEIEQSTEYTKFSEEDVESYENERYENFAKKDGQKDDNDSREKSNSNEEQEKTEPKDKEDENEKDKDKKQEKKYSLSELQEYANAQTISIREEYDSLKNQYSLLEQEIAPLRQFKQEAELKSKQDMINSFYMLSEDDKKDVIDNINTYSLNDIEAILSIICVRNKVSFDLDEEGANEQSSFTYSLEQNGSDNAPAWIKAARQIAKNK